MDRARKRAGHLSRYAAKSLGSMNRLRPSQILALILLVQAVLKIGYPISGLRMIGQFELTAIGIGLLTLLSWVLLVASGVGLFLGRRWAFPCMFGFAALTPVAMLPFVPLVMRLFAPGNMLFLIGMLIVNCLVAAAAVYLVRRESGGQAA